MTEAILQDRTGRNTADRVQAGLKRRYAAERRFRIYGLISILTAMGFLAALLTSIAGNGYGAFLQTHVRLDILFSKADLDPGGTGDPAVLRQGNYDALIKDALALIMPLSLRLSARDVTSGKRWASASLISAS